MNRLILFLIRRKLGVKKWQQFNFSNQACASDRYVITGMSIYKFQFINGEHVVTGLSNISVNFLLSSEAKEMISRY